MIVAGVLPGLISGRIWKRFTKHTRARKALLLTDRPSFFHGDGEILGPTPVEIEVLPKAATILAPAAPQFAAEKKSFAIIFHGVTEMGESISLAKWSHARLHPAPEQQV